MPPYRVQPIRSIRIRFADDTPFAGTEVVCRSRIEVGDTLMLLRPLEMAATAEEQRRRVVAWGDAWLLSWNVEQPLLHPETGEQVLDPDGEPMWVPMPCDGEHLAQTDPLFYVELVIQHTAAINPQSVREQVVDPNSPGSSSSGGTPAPTSGPMSDASSSVAEPEPEPDSPAPVAISARRRPN